MEKQCANSAEYFGEERACERSHPRCLRRRRYRVVDVRQDHYLEVSPIAQDGPSGSELVLELFEGMSFRE